MPKGGARPGAGRKRGIPNKATIEREINAAQVIDNARKSGRDLAVTVLERLMNVAEGAAGLHRPPAPAQIKAAEAEGKPIEKGDWDLFGQWFDRAMWCAEKLAKYQSPPIKAMEAPTPPPDPADEERKNRKRFGLRIFEGGNVVPIQSEKAAS